MARACTPYPLRRDLCYAHEGKILHRHHEDQTEQALCLTW